MGNVEFEDIISQLRNNIGMTQAELGKLNVPCVPDANFNRLSSLIFKKIKP